MRSSFVKNGQHRFFRVHGARHARLNGTALAACTSLLLSSCAPVVNDVRSPGGYFGSVMDKRVFDASRSKQLQLLRATIILTMAASMATTTVRDGKDADAFADYLAAASDELNYAAADLYDVDGTAPCGLRPDAEATTACASYYADFESEVPLLEGRVVRLVLAGLPEGQAKKFLDDVRSGDLLAASWAAVRAAGDVAAGLHRSAGVYRSGLELLAATACVNGAFNEAKDSVWAADECLGLSHDRFGDSPNELRGEALHLPVKRDAFHALMLVARSACIRLPIATDKVATDELSARDKVCQAVQFKPKVRPLTISVAQ